MAKLPHCTILLLYALFFGSNSIQAVPITWTLSGVTFDDGGTATGSFVFDADLPPFGQYFSINITTSGGSIPGKTYVGPNAAVPGTSGQLFAFETTGALAAGQTFVTLTFTPFNLTNSGGTVPVDPAFSGENLIFNAALDTIPLRFVTAGFVSAPDGGSTFLLFALGFGAVAWLRRKKRSST